MAGRRNRWRWFALALVVMTVSASAVCQPVEAASSRSAGPAVVTRSLPPARGDRVYGATLSASGGRSPYRWRVAGLPGGLSLSGNRIVGQPTQAGSFQVAVAVTDGAGHQAARTLLLVVLNPAQVDAMARLNADRVALGRHPLGWQLDMSAAAQAWATHLAQTGPPLTHDLSNWRPPCANGPNTAWAENVGYGRTVAEVEAAFMASPHHRPNILNPNFTTAMTAVVYAGGWYYVVQRFTKGC